MATSDVDSREPDSREESVQLAFVLEFLGPAISPTSPGLVDPQAFWNSLRPFYAQPSQSSVPASVFENVARTKFAENLREAIATNFAPIDPGLAKTVQVSFIDFRYGSFEILIGLPILKSFAALLTAAGPEFCLKLLATCGDDAFEKTFAAHSPGAVVHLSGALRAHMATTTVVAGDPVKPGWGDVFVLGAQKVFWLVPTILGLLVMGVALRALVQIAPPVGCGL